MELDVCVNCNEKYYAEGQIDEMICLRKILKRKK
jgi:hypothetical protein